jgi:hypothetical protein
VENPRGMLKSATKLELPDLNCFIRKLDTLEADVERTRELANAWSLGRTEELQKLTRARPRDELLQESCAYVLMTALKDGTTEDAAHAKRAFDDVLWHAEQASAQAQINWVTAAQKALEKNRSTFAVLPVGDVFRPDGHLEKLRALGYAVEEPR